MQKPLIVAYFALLFGFAWTSPANAKFLRPDSVPVERLVKNISTHLEENPNDASAHYLLARIHYLAYHQKSEVLNVYQRGNNLPSIAHWQQKPAKDTKLTDKQLKHHISESVIHFKKSIKLNNKGLHYLGLANILEAGATMADYLPPAAESIEKNPVLSVAREKEIEKKIDGLYADDAETLKATNDWLIENMDDAAPLIAQHTKTAEEPIRKHINELFATYWKHQAVEHYAKAYEMTQEKDGKITHKPLRGLNSLVSFEAANSYVRLTKELGQEGEEVKKNSKKMEEHVAALENKRQGPVTPIVFSMEEAKSLNELLEPGNIVRFDLDGDGQAELRPWVAADTAILVWDPERKGEITSGRQLFGNVTWWMFFDNGYSAMDALDDNRDGRLSGKELPDLAIWLDRNGNAISEPGEVTPIEETAIAWLSVEATSADPDQPHQPFGLGLNDGRVLPTYDWVAPAVENLENVSEPTDGVK